MVQNNVHAHEENWNTGREKESITRKYASLHRTGNPNITPLIKLAKEIKHLIGIKATIGDGEEEFDLEEGYMISEDNTTLVENKEENNKENNSETNSPPPL